MKGEHTCDNALQLQGHGALLADCWRLFDLTNIVGCLPESKSSAGQLIDAMSCVAMSG